MSSFEKQTIGHTSSAAILSLQRVGPGSIKFVNLRKWTSAQEATRERHSTNLLSLDGQGNWKVSLYLKLDFLSNLKTDLAFDLVLDLVTNRRSTKMSGSNHLDMQGDLTACVRRFAPRKGPAVKQW